MQLYQNTKATAPLGLASPASGQALHVTRGCPGVAGEAIHISRLFTCLY